MLYIKCAPHAPLKQNHLQKIYLLTQKVGTQLFLFTEKFDNLVKCERKHEERAREYIESGKIKIVP